MASAFENPIYQAARAARFAKQQGSGYEPVVQTPGEADQPTQEPEGVQTAPKQSWGEWGASTAVSGLSAVGNALDLTSSMSRDLQTWLPGGIEPHNPLDQTLDPFGRNADKNRVSSGRDILRSYGLVGKNDTWGNFGAGLAWEVVTDPLTYTGMGVLGRGAKALSQAGFLANKADILKEMAESAGRSSGRVGRGSAKKATTRQLFDHWKAKRDEIITKSTEGTVQGQRLKGKNTYSSVDELKSVDAKDGQWGVVDSGGKYEIYQYNPPGGKEGWQKLDEPSEALMARLAETATNATLDTIRNSYKSQFNNLYPGMSPDEALDKPIESIVSFRVPWTNIQKDINVPDAGPAIDRWFKKQKPLEPTNRKAAADDIADAVEGDVPDVGATPKPKEASPAPTEPETVDAWDPEEVKAKAKDWGLLQEDGSIKESRVGPNATRVLHQAAKIFGTQAVESWDIIETAGVGAAKLAGMDADEFFKQIDISRGTLDDLKKLQEGGALAQTAYHGSPHSFEPEALIKTADGAEEFVPMDKIPDGAEVKAMYPLGRFSTAKIGTGEGAQAYGWGLYFAEKEDVSRWYRDKLSMQKADPNAIYYKRARIPRGTAADLVAKQVLQTPSRDIREAIEDLVDELEWEINQAGMAKIQAGMRKFLESRYPGEDIGQAALRHKEATQKALEEVKSLDPSDFLRKNELIVTTPRGTPPEVEEAIRKWKGKFLQDEANAQRASGNPSWSSDAKRPLARHLRSIGMGDYADAVISGEIAVERFKPKGGSLYKVDLKPAEDEYLLWDKPLSEQSEKVKRALEQVGYDMSRIGSSELTGSWAYKNLTKLNNSHLDELEAEIDKIEGLSEYIDTEDVIGQIEGAIENLGASQVATVSIVQYMLEKGVPLSVADKVREAMSRVIWSNLYTPQEASKRLSGLGVRGIKYLDGSSRGRGEGHYNYVIFDDADVAIEAALAQKKRNGAARGAIFINNLQKAIRIFSEGDISTLHHEFAHGMRQMLPKDIQEQAVKAIAERMAKLKIKGPVVGKDGEWTREAEEVWASSWEKYLKEGKAPTKGLEAAFAKMKEWLTEIYKVFRNHPTLSRKLDKKTREIFDKILKTGDDELSRAARMDDYAATGKVPDETYGSIVSKIKDNPSNPQLDEFESVVFSGKADEINKRLQDGTTKAAASAADDAIEAVADDIADEAVDGLDDMAGDMASGVADDTPTADAPYVPPSINTLEEAIAEINADKRASVVADVMDRAPEELKQQIRDYAIKLKIPVSEGAGDIAPPAPTAAPRANPLLESAGRIRAKGKPRSIEERIGTREAAPEDRLMAGVSTRGDVQNLEDAMPAGAADELVRKSRGDSVSPPIQRPTPIQERAAGPLARRVKSVAPAARSSGVSLSDEERLLMKDAISQDKAVSRPAIEKLGFKGAELERVESELAMYDLDREKLEHLATRLDFGEEDAAGIAQKAAKEVDAVKETIDPELAARRAAVVQKVVNNPDVREDFVQKLGTVEGDVDEAAIRILEERIKPKGEDAARKLHKLLMEGSDEYQNSVRNLAKKATTTQSPVEDAARSKWIDDADFGKVPHEEILAEAPERLTKNSPEAVRQQASQDAGGWNKAVRESERVTDRHLFRKLNLLKKLGRREEADEVVAEIVNHYRTGSEALPKLLARSILKGQSNPELLESLEAVAEQELLKLVERFDYRDGNLFRSYASKVIPKKLINEIPKQQELAGGIKKAVALGGDEAADQFKDVAAGKVVPADAAEKIAAVLSKVEDEGHRDILQKVFLDQVEKTVRGKKVLKNRTRKSIAEELDISAGTLKKRINEALNAAYRVGMEAFDDVADPASGTKVLGQSGLASEVAEAGARTADEAAEAAKEWRTKGVKSSFFKRWFGDWENDPINASKVVDEAGRPLRVFHGTDSNFDVFDTSPSREMGSHFGDADQASELAISRGSALPRMSERDIADFGLKSFVAPVYLSIKNPVRMGDPGYWTLDKISKWATENPHRFDSEAIEAIEEAKEILRKEGVDLVGDSRGAEELKKALQRRGFDGIVYENMYEGDGTSYIAFSPNQIKSATANTGAFDSGNPSILAQKTAVESISDTPPPKSAMRTLYDQKRDSFNQILQNIDSPSLREKYANALDVGDHLFLSSAPVRYFNKLFDKSVMGQYSHDAQTLARKRHRAVQRAIFEARGLISGITRAIGHYGFLDEDKATRELIQQGMGAADAKQAAKELLNKRNSEIVRYLEGAVDKAGVKSDLSRKLFQDEQAAREIEQLLDVIQSIFPKRLRSEGAAGLSDFSLADEYIEYFPRNRHSESRRATSASEAIDMLFDTSRSSQKKRKAAFRNLPGGRAVLDDLSIDPEISGVYFDQVVQGKKGITKAMLKRSTDKMLTDEYRHRIFDPKKHFDENGELNKAGAAHARKLATAMAQIPKIHSQSKIPIFGRNVLHDMAKYIEDSIAMEGVARAAQEVVASNVLPPGLKTQFTVSKLFQDLKLDRNQAYLNVIESAGRKKQYRTWEKRRLASIKARIEEKGSFRYDGGKSKLVVSDDGEWQVLNKDDELLRTISDSELAKELKLAKKYVDRPGKEFTVNKETYDVATQYMSKWSTPKPINEIQNFSRAMLHLFKTNVTLPFPAFHVRNFISGMAQNFFYDAYDPTGGITGRYTRPVKQAYIMRSGKTVKGLYNQLPKHIRDLVDSVHTGTNKDDNATEWIREQVFKYGITGDKQGYAAEEVGESLSSLLSQYPGAKEREISARNLWGLLRDPQVGVPLKDKVNLLHIRGAGRPTIAKDDLGVAKLTTKRYDETTSTLHRTGEDLAQVTEDINRISPFIAFLKQGVAPEEAARRVQRIQIDYSNLSETEKAIRNFVPFYTFSSKIMHLTLGDLLSRPAGKQAIAIRAANRAQSPETLAPDHIKRGVAIPLGQTESGADRYVTGFGLAFEDPLQFGGVLRGDWRGAAGEVLGRMRPELQAVSEIATGRNLFFDRDLDDMDPPIGRFLSNVRQGITGEKTEGLAEPFPTAGVEYAIGKSPLSRYTSTLVKMTDHRKGILPRLANTLTGGRVTDVEPEARERVAIDMASDALKEFGGRDMSLTYMPSWQKARLSEEKLQQVEAIQSFISEVQRQGRERKKAAESLQTSMSGAAGDF